MTKFALLIYNMDHVYHYIPLLCDGTIEQAQIAALEYIDSGDLGLDCVDLNFEIVEIAKIHKYNTNEFDDFFKKKAEEHKKRMMVQQDRFDKEQFERLKKKFGE